MRVITLNALMWQTHSSGSCSDCNAINFTIPLDLLHSANYSISRPTDWFSSNCECSAHFVLSILMHSSTFPRFALDCAFCLFVFRSAVWCSKLKYNIIINWKSQHPFCLRLVVWSKHLSKAVLSCWRRVVPFSGLYRICVLPIRMLCKALVR